MDLDAIRKQLSELHDSAFGWSMVCCGRDRDLSVDVLQEAYCRILGGEASYSGKSEFSTWVFGVIRHVAHEETRRRRRERQNHRTTTSVDRPPANHVERDIQSHESADRLNEALAKLSERQRELLHMTFYEGMTIQQAADVLKITVGSARQHYQRGKSAVRRILETNQEFNDERRG